MDLESLVREARSGDVKAFVELTRRFQQAAYGSALTLVRDFQQAKDVVQEAFIAAWAGLPNLAEPAAFPAWLRGIVRHQAFRVLRKQPNALPLDEAETMPSEEPAADRVLEHRDEASCALAAIGQLPDALREPATLFFVHECSHQDIATFLGLSVPTVNNRLHAARKQLKQRMLTMMKDLLHSHGLPDDFANRIGRLVEARGGIVEALFDPASMPDVLTELAVSDEANERAVNVHVVQRAGDGLVRSVALSQIDALPPATPASIRTRRQTIYSSTNHRCRPRESVAVAAGKMHKAALSQASLCPETARGKPYSFRRPARCRLGRLARCL